MGSRTNPSRQPTRATVLLHLEEVGDRFEARYRLADLDLIPSEAEVILRVGGCRPGYEATYLLRQHRHRLNYVLHADACTVGDWRRAIDGPDDWAWQW